MSCYSIVNTKDGGCQVGGFPLPVDGGLVGARGALRGNTKSGGQGKTSHSPFGAGDSGFFGSGGGGQGGNQHPAKGMDAPWGGVAATSFNLQKKVRIASEVVSSDGLTSPSSLYTICDDESARSSGDKCKITPSPSQASRQVLPEAEAHPSSGDRESARALHRLAVVSALRSAGWQEVADRVEGCGQTARKMRCRDCDREWIAPSRCHHRICPDCGQIRATRLFNAHKGLTGQPNLKHLVLTLLNTPYLSWETVPDLRRSFTKLRRRKPFNQAWRGGLYSIEFTYTKDKGFHPHIHALVDGDYVPQAVISKAWKEITGSSEVVWIARAESSRQVLKYILKPSAELLDEPTTLDNFLTVVEGRHFVSGWGKWYRATERSLMGEATCPFCGSSNIISIGKGYAWSSYYGRWVERSPPRGLSCD